MFFLKIIDDQDQELELTKVGPFADPKEIPMAQLGGRPSLTAAAKLATACSKRSSPKRSHQTTRANWRRPSEPAA